MSSTLAWASLAAVLAILVLARRPLLERIAAFLVVRDPPAPWDAIVILNGNINTRPYRAAELYRQHPAPILIARLSDTEVVRLGVIPNISDATGELLALLGVDRRDIGVIGSSSWVAGTRDEAILIGQTIRARRWATVAIVTDAFHTRRARRIFRLAAGDGHVRFVMYPTAYSLGTMPRWWASQYALIQVVIEYLKFAHYLCTERTFARACEAARQATPSVVPR